MYNLLVNFKKLYQNLISNVKFIIFKLPLPRDWVEAFSYVKSFILFNTPIPQKVLGIIDFNQFNFALDVLEHIEKNSEDLFMKNIVESLAINGTLIIGMPSLESQVYASEASKLGHVNCKSGNELLEFSKKYFHNVYSFSMNDEVLHTGFYPMSHYLFTLNTNKK